MLTYDTVVAAIAVIKARGQRPSLNLILHETGGSKTDISRHFKRWRTEQAARDAAPPPPEIAALEALSPDLATRIRQAYEDRSRVALSTAQEELAFAQQHVADLERALGDAETIQTQLRTELDDRATSEQRLADAMACQQHAFLDALKAMQHDMHEAIGSLDSRCAELANGMIQMRDAIAGVQTEAREQAAALSQSVGTALDEQRLAYRDQCAAERAAILQALHVRHLATLRAVRAECARLVLRSPQMTGSPTAGGGKGSP